MSEANQRIDLAVLPDAQDHAQGAEHARVVVVEYGDFECASCKVAAPAAGMLLKRYPNRIRFIFRHFPLEQAHPHALAAAQAAEAAAAEGRFWPMHDVLFENQTHLGPKDLSRYAAELGLDMARFTAQMDDQVYLQKIREHLDGGRRSHIRATPAFFVNGVMQDVSFGVQALHDAVAVAVKAAG